MINNSTELVQISVGDAGRFWRRVARCGALLCTFAIFTPIYVAGYLAGFWVPAIKWTTLISTWGIPLNKMEGIVVHFTIAMVPCMALSGPIMMFLCSPRPMQNNIHRYLTIIAMEILWLATIIPVYWAYNDILLESPFWLLLCILLYLYLGVLIALHSRRLGLISSPFYALGVVPLIASVAGWCCHLPLLLFICAPMTDISRSHMHYSLKDVPLQFSIICFVGIIGSILMLIGWLKCWKACFKAYSAGGCTASP